MGIELNILDCIQIIRTPFLDEVMKFVTRLANDGIIWILLAVILVIIPKTRKSGAIVILALCIDFILCNVILKNVFCRIRPYDVNTAIQIIISKPHDFSFPSGHTAVSFAAASALFFAGEKKLWKPALILAVLIAFSRMYLYVHYPTDILGGALVGTLSGYIAFYVISKVSRQKEK